jgi:hypothetical protein
MGGLIARSTFRDRHRKRFEGWPDAFDYRSSGGGTVG